MWGDRLFPDELSIEGFEKTRYVLEQTFGPDDIIKGYVTKERHEELFYGTICHEELLHGSISPQVLSKGRTVVLDLDCGTHTSVIL